LPHECAARRQARRRAPIILDAHHPQSARAWRNIKGGTAGDLDAIAVKVQRAGKIATPSYRGSMS